ncbi:MAG: hypothetical protein M0R17_05650 [Candidatus Omnitrophica bacterium]|jgi:phage FluMu protein Com|nr:hypothetical protein [Candidatus Omnitrophota bacterium]
MIELKLSDLTICHNCNGVLLKQNIGKKCPYCGEWTYNHLSEQALEKIFEEKERGK